MRCDCHPVDLDILFDIVCNDLFVKIQPQVNNIQLFCGIANRGHTVVENQINCRN